jgi:beta-lactamase class A
MLVESDNSAADIMFDLAGGPRAVATRLGTLGISDISVDRPSIQLVADAAGVTNLPVKGPVYPAWWSATKKAVPRDIKKAAWRAFLNDTRDTATPEAMVRLLAMIGRGLALSREQTALFLEIMTRCSTGKKRLKGLLPIGTRVAHKTGSLPEGVNNDVGIIELPNGGGHVAVAAFVIGLPGEERKQDKVIARIGRTIYDHFANDPGLRKDRVV